MTLEKRISDMKDKLLEIQAQLKNIPHSKEIAIALAAIIIATIVVKAFF